MSKSKKFLAGALAAMSIASLGLFVSAMPAKADANSDLQAQITALLAQIAALQAQLNGGSSNSFVFTRNLTVGSKGNDVLQLQVFLNAHGYLVATAGPGSKGNETTYFGGLTRTALAKWQASVGISPAVGFFGPITRAKVNSMGGVVIVPPPGPPVPPVSGALGVSLAASQPSGAAIAGAGQINTATFNLTAGAAPVTVTGLTFTKTGVVSDSSVSNLYLADSSGVIVGQLTSLSQGVATFSNLNLSIPANTTYQVTLRMDLSSSASAGNTIGWSLSNVMTSGAGAVSGTPVNGPTLQVTTVSNPSIATAAFTFNAVGSSVDAGTSNVLVGSLTANVNNSPVNLGAIKFTLVGSANASDIKNLTLKVNGQTAGTVASVGANGAIQFSLSPAVRLNTGNNTLELYADVLGSPNRTAQFTILRPFDIYVVDTQYNTGISPSVVTTNATTITINQGQITVSLASDTPTNQVPNGASAVTLAKINIYASGEPVQVKFLDVTITKAGGAVWGTGNAAAVNNDLANLRLVDDQGVQIGSTISTIVEGSGNGQCTLTSATAMTCHFGTSASQINYTIPANTTRKISIQTDIKSTNDVTSIQASLPGNTANLQGQTSFQTANSGSVTASNLTVSTTPLSITANSAFGTTTVVRGAIQKKVASFVIAASPAQGATISSLTFDKDAGTDNLDLQNLNVYANGVHFGTTRPTIADGGVTMSFSGSAPVTQGGSTVIDVYADVLTSSSNATYSSVIDLTGWSALGSTNSSVAFPGAVDGQNLTVVSSGVISSVTVNPTTPAAKQVVMGSTNVEVARFRIQASNNEGVRINTLKITVIGTSSAPAAFSNLTLKDVASSTVWQSGIALTASSTPGSYIATFSPGTNLINQNETRELAIYADVAQYTNLPAAHGLSYTFGIQNPNTDVVAVGSDSNQSANPASTTAVNGPSITTVRTKLTTSLSTLGATSARVRSAVDDVANLNVTVDPAYPATLQQVRLTFSGSAPTSTFTVSLVDSSGNTIATTSVVSGVATFSSLARVITTPGETIKIRINSSGFNSGLNGNAVSMSIQIAAATDVTWQAQGDATNLNLEGSQVPQTVTVSYQ